jgi:hypothetical protein
MSLGILLHRTLAGYFVLTRAHTSPMKTGTPRMDPLVTNLNARELFLSQGLRDTVSRNDTPTIPMKAGTPKMSLVTYYLERSPALLFLDGHPHLPNENCDSQMSLSILFSPSACFSILNVFPGTSSSSSTPPGGCLLHCNVTIARGETKSAFCFQGDYTYAA